MTATLARRLSAVLIATTVATTVTLVAGTAPAHAAPTASVVSRVSGSLYTGNIIINQGVIPGPDTGRNFGFKVVNTGSQPEQYKIVVSPDQPAVTFTTLTQGSTVLKNPYYTATIAPGASATFNLKVTLANSIPQDQYLSYVYVRDPETNANLDYFIADANATYQAGNTRNDLFVKTGTQPAVGGSESYQYESGAALKTGSSTTYSLKLANDGTTTAAVHLLGVAPTSCPSTDYSYVVKAGTKDVTQDVYVNGYATPLLSPGQSKTLKLTVKRTSSNSCAEYFTFLASGADPDVRVSAHAVPAA